MAPVSDPRKTVLSCRSIRSSRDWSTDPAEVAWNENSATWMTPLPVQMRKIQPNPNMRRCAAQQNGISGARNNRRAVSDGGWVTSRSDPTMSGARSEEHTAELQQL